MNIISNKATDCLCKLFKDELNKHSYNKQSNIWKTVSLFKVFVLIAKQNKSTICCLAMTLGTHRSHHAAHFALITSARQSNQFATRCCLTGSSKCGVVNQLQLHFPFRELVFHSCFEAAMGAYSTGFRKTGCMEAACAKQSVNGVA